MWKNIVSFSAVVSLMCSSILATKSFPCPFGKSLTFSYPLAVSVYAPPLHKSCRIPHIITESCGTGFCHFAFSLENSLVTLRECWHNPPEKTLWYLVLAGARK